jgi:hypothetical protein
VQVEGRRHDALFQGDHPWTVLSASQGRYLIHENLNSGYKGLRQWTERLLRRNSDDTSGHSFLLCVAKLNGDLRFVSRKTYFFQALVLILLSHTHQAPQMNARAK